MTHEFNPTMATRILKGDGSAPSRRIRTFKLRVTDANGEISEQTYDQQSVRIGSRECCELVLQDKSVSRIHCEISADEYGFLLRDLGSSNGTVVNGYRTRDIYLHPQSEITLGKTSIVFEPLEVEVEIPRTPVDKFGPLVGGSLRMREIYSLIENAAATDATILIEGESGTGKELFSEAVHIHSPRAKMPFIVFDCAAISANLLESELFGHEKGAFTGAATRRVGCLEEANGGTVFLDEIGELPLDLQPKLLRAIERREIKRVGSNKSIKVDVRFVAATNRDLAREVNKGTFREDLYYRLAVVRLKVPPLRDRREDLPLLVMHFLTQFSDGDAKRAASVFESVQDETWERLKTHPWPGNIRELRNLLERTLALSSEGNFDSQLAPEPVPSFKTADKIAVASAGIDLDKPFVQQKHDLVAAFEKNYLTQMLRRHGGNYSQAAAAAGIDRMYFKRILKKYES